MARYRITGPDGKTYTISGPDDATDDELIAFVTEQAEPQAGEVPSFEQYRQDMGLPERQKPGRLSGEYAGGMLRSVNQFIPFADEVASGVNTAIGYNPSKGSYFDYGPGASYGKNLAAERGALKEFRQDYPYDAMAGEAAPGLATGAGLAKAAASRVPTVAGRMAKALTPAGGSVAGNIMRGASSAAVPGYAYGFAAGEGGAANRMESGQNSALLAALLGGGFTGAAEAAPRAWNAGGRLLKRVTGSQGLAQQSPALRKLAKTIMSGNPDMSPDEAMVHARMRLEELGPEAVMGDINDEARLLTGTVYRQGDAPAAVIRNKVIPRQEGVRDPATGALQGGQAGRVGEALDDLGSPRLTARQAKLYQERSAAGREAFEEALDTGPIYSDRLKQFTDDPVMKGGFARGLELERLDALANNRPFDPHKYGVTGFNEAGDPVLGKVPTMRTYQAMKEGLSAQIADEMDDFGRLSKRGVALQKVLDKYLEELDAFNPAYAQARQAWAGPSQQLDASRQGFRFMRKGEFANSDELAARLEKMTPDEKHHFRIGAIQALRDKMGETVRRGDVTKHLAGKPELERKIRLAFGDDRLFRRYINAMENEGEMFKLYSEITGGSQTQQRQAAARSLQGEPAGAAGAALDVMANAPTRPISTALGAIPRAGRAAIEWARKMPEGQRLELAKALMGRDVGALTQQAVIANMSDEARRRLIQALTGANIAATPVAQRPELEPASRY